MGQSLMEQLVAAAELARSKPMSKDWADVRRRGTYDPDLESASSHDGVDDLPFGHGDRPETAHPADRVANPADALLEDAKKSLNTPYTTMLDQINQYSAGQEGAAKAERASRGERNDEIMRAVSAPLIPASFLGGPVGVLAGAGLTGLQASDAIGNVKEGDYGQALLNGVLAAVGARGLVKQPALKALEWEHIPGVDTKKGIHWPGVRRPKALLEEGSDQLRLGGNSGTHGGGGGLGEQKLLAESNLSRTAPENADDLAEQVNRGFDPSTEIRARRRSPMSDVNDVAEQVQRGFNPSDTLNAGQRTRGSVNDIREQIGRGFNPKAEIENALEARSARQASETDLTSVLDDLAEPGMSDVEIAAERSAERFGKRYKNEGGAPKREAAASAGRGPVRRSEPVNSPSNVLDERDAEALKTTLFGGLHGQSKFKKGGQGGVANAETISNMIKYLKQRAGELNRGEF